MARTLYDLDYKKIKEGLEELMKDRVNGIRLHRGRYTLAHVLNNYRETKELALEFGVDALKYDEEVRQLQETFERIK